MEKTDNPEKVLNDQELVQKILAKDPQAERHFFRVHRDRLYRACTYVLGYRDPEVEDVVQETFVAAFQSISGFEFRSSLSHWLVRIAMNRCYERIRKRQRQVVHAQNELEALDGLSSVERDRQKQQDADHHGLLNVIEAQKEALGEPCKGLLRLWDEERQSYASIAEILKVPIGTVMSRLSRCKKALKELVLGVLKEGSNG